MEESSAGYNQPVTSDFEGFGDFEEDAEEAVVCAVCGADLAEPEGRVETATGVFCCAGCVAAEEDEAVAAEEEERGAAAAVAPEAEAGEGPEATSVGETIPDAAVQQTREDALAELNAFADDALAETGGGETPAAAAAPAVEEGIPAALLADEDAAAEEGSAAAPSAPLDDDVVPVFYLVDPPETLAAACLETEEEAAAYAASLAAGAAVAEEDEEVNPTAETLRLKPRTSRRGGPLSRRGSSRKDNGESVRASARTSRSEGPKSEAQLRKERHAKFIVYGGFIALTLIFVGLALYRIFVGPIFVLGGE